MIDLQHMLLSLPGITIGLVFHEFAHAYVSDKLGDPTPREQGRLTLSPLAHLDPIGFLLILFLGFGWAKPVQINKRYYKNPKRDDLLVSLAGPATNLLIAVLFAFALKLFGSLNFIKNMQYVPFKFLSLIFLYGIIINLTLFVLNIIPIPPLDGFSIVSNIISPRYYELIYKLHQYGSIILIIIIVTPVAKYIIGIPADYLFTFLQRAIGF